NREEQSSCNGSQRRQQAIVHCLKAFRAAVHHTRFDKRNSVHSFVVEDIADILSEITAIAVLIGFCVRLWIFMHVRALSRPCPALAVECIAQSTSRTVGLEIVGYSFRINSRIFAQATEGSTHASCRQIRRRKIVLVENIFNITLVKKRLDFLVGESTFREALACMTIECGSVSGGEDGPLVGWRLLNTMVTGE